MDRPLTSREFFTIRMFRAELDGIETGQDILDLFRLIDSARASERGTLPQMTDTDPEND